MMHFQCVQKVCSGSTPSAITNSRNLKPTDLLDIRHFRAYLTCSFPASYGYLEKPEKDLDPVPDRSEESMADQSAC